MRRPRVQIPLKPRQTFFRATSQLLKLRFNCDGHIFISFVLPQFTSFHSDHVSTNLEQSSERDLLQGDVNETEQKKGD